MITEIRYRDKDRPNVKVLFNDSVEARLILDTGAPYTVITPKAAKKIFGEKKLISKGIKMGWTDGSTSPGQMILVDSVKIGNTGVKNVKVVVSEISIIGQEAEGLLGMSFLKYFDINIDAARKKITLKRK